MSSESEAHKNIKVIIYNKMKDWYGASITEYYDESHELDIYSMTLNGISIYVEVIWSSSKQHFIDDLLIIQRANADIIFTIVSPEIISDEKKRREYEKTLISKRKSGTLMFPMINGQNFLDNPSYVDTEFRHIVDIALIEKRSEEKKREPNLEVHFFDETVIDSEEIVVKPVYLKEIIVKQKDPYYKVFQQFLESQEVLQSLGVFGKTPDPDMVPINIKIKNSGTIGANHINIFLTFPENCMLFNEYDVKWSYTPSYPNIQKRYSGLHKTSKNIAKGTLDFLGNDLHFKDFSPIYVRFPQEAEKVEVNINIIQDGYPPKEKKMKIIIQPTRKEVKKVEFEE
jgi:hypothetical protein